MPGTTWNSNWNSDYVLAKKINSYKQRGQTCGIYALQAALKGHNIAVPPATYGEARLIDSSLAKLDKHKIGRDPELNPLSLRELAKKKGTKVGELFDILDVKRLGSRYKGDIDVKFFKDEPALKYIVKREIDQKRFIMIAFQPNKAGEPSVGSGDNAHWCTILDIPKRHQQLRLC